MRDTCKTGSTQTALVLLAVGLLAACARTPPITNADGEPLPGSVATLEKVELNGSEQWITVRGRDASNPILLFLAGGPGSGELPSTRLHLPELEESFTVVNWDQPGAGKSFRAVPFDELTPQRYVEDAVALIDLLLQRFGQERVYLLGASWGSYLGIRLSQAAPEKVAAVVGSGQMVTFAENDVMGYEFAIDYLERRGDTSQAQKLRELGPPPYTQGNVAFQYMQYLDVLNRYRHTSETGEDNDIMRDALRAPEYTLRDRINWIRGLAKVFNVVYPQLQGADLRDDARRLEVPVYMILGRHDVNAMPVFVQEYFEVLEAPHKELIWFEKSGHTAHYAEPDRLIELMQRVREES